MSRNRSISKLLRVGVWAERRIEWIRVNCVLKAQRVTRDSSLNFSRDLGVLSDLARKVAETNLYRSESVARAAEKWLADNEIRPTDSASVRELGRWPEDIARAHRRAQRDGHFVLGTLSDHRDADDFRVKLFRPEYLVLHVCLAANYGRCFVVSICGGRTDQQHGKRHLGRTKHISSLPMRFAKQRFASGTE